MSRRGADAQLGHLVVTALLAFEIAACGGPTATSTATPTATPSAATIQQGRMTVDGQLRTYRLFRPQSASPGQLVPLIVLLHGCPSTSDQMAAMTHFDDEAIAGRFIVAYPDGTPCWNDGSGINAWADDVTFISRLLDRLTTDLPVDQTRIFIAGFSVGAFMSYRLACELSSRIVAIASVSGTMRYDQCHPARPVSVLEMHGTMDSTVPYDGGIYSPKGDLQPAPSAAKVTQSWAGFDGCVGDPVQSQSGIVKVSVWNTCKAGTVVRLDTVVGGYHQWFGSDFNPVPGEPDANAVIWSFFSSLHPTN